MDLERLMDWGQLIITSHHYQIKPNGSLKITTLYSTAGNMNSSHDMESQRPRKYWTYKALDSMVQSLGFSSFVISGLLVPVILSIFVNPWLAACITKSFFAILFICVLCWILLYTTVWLHSAKLSLYITLECSQIIYFHSTSKTPNLTSKISTETKIQDTSAAEKVPVNTL